MGALGVWGDNSCSSGGPEMVLPGLPKDGSGQEKRKKKKKTAVVLLFNNNYMGYRKWDPRTPEVTILPLSNLRKIARAHFPRDCLQLGPRANHSVV